MCILKIVGFLTRPAAAYKEVKERGFFEAFVYNITLALVPAFVLAVFSSVFFQGYFLDFVVVYKNFIFFSVFWPVWVHLWLRVFRVKGMEKTYTALFYSYTPLYLFLWVIILIYMFFNNMFILLLSFMGFLAIMFWTAVLQVIGLKTFHKARPKNIYAGFVLSVTVFVILLLVFMMFFLIPYNPGMVA